LGVVWGLYSVQSPGLGSFGGHFEVVWGSFGVSIQSSLQDWARLGVSIQSSLQDWAHFEVVWGSFGVSIQSSLQEWGSYWVPSPGIWGTNVSFLQEFEVGI
jgi:hypothetical protein